MPHDPIKLGRNITTQRGRNFKVMTADRQIHKKPPALRVKKVASKIPATQTPKSLITCHEFTMPPIRLECNPFY
jgi:hypothetical protein